MVSIKQLINEYIMEGTYGPGDQKLENGTVIRPNGDTIYPNGTVKTGDGAIIEGGKKVRSISDE